MNRYILYIGSNNETGAVETELAQEVLDMAFTGYNIVKSTGVWNGKHECGINVTIYTEYTLAQIKRITKRLCKVLGQACIIVGYKLDCGVEFVEQ